MESFQTLTEIKNRYPKRIKDYSYYNDYYKDYNNISSYSPASDSSLFKTALYKYKNEISRFNSLPQYNSDLEGIDEICLFNMPLSAYKNQYYSGPIYDSFIDKYYKEIQSILLEGEELWD